jgi:hypothetical protein
MPTHRRQVSFGMSEPCDPVISDDWWSQHTKQSGVSLLLPIFVVLSTVMAHFLIISGLLFLVMITTAPVLSTSATPLNCKDEATLRVLTHSTCARVDVDVNVCILTASLCLLAASMFWIVPYFVQRAQLSFPPVFVNCIIIICICEGMVAFLLCMRAYYCLFQNSHGPIFAAVDEAYFGQALHSAAIETGVLTAGSILNAGNFLIFTTSVVVIVFVIWCFCSCGLLCCT